MTCLTSESRWLDRVSHRDPIYVPHTDDEYDTHPFPQWHTPGMGTLASGKGRHVNRMKFMGYLGEYHINIPRYVPDDSFMLTMACRRVNHQLFGNAIIYIKADYERVYRNRGFSYSGRNLFVN